MYTPNVIGLTSMSYLIAAFGSLKSNREYVVADKKVNRVENIETETFVLLKDNEANPIAIE